MTDIDHLRQWIGREEVRSELLTPAIAERFNATFGLAGGTQDGDIAPLLIHLCLAPAVVSTQELGPDGHPARGGFLPPVPLPRRMWAGGAFAFHDDIRIGETVTRHSEIRDISLKQGRSGPLCFVIVRHRIESDGRLVLTERQDIVYREADRPGATKKALPPAPHGTHRIEIEPSAPLLFRYSALTFNGHRIHYDASYTREEEGYPGLIVHGPMQATMLAQLAADIMGRRPASFEFRSLSPLFDNANFTLNATEEEGRLTLWTSYADGPVAMTAQAE